MTSRALRSMEDGTLVAPAGYPQHIQTSTTSTPMNARSQASPQGSVPLFLFSMSPFYTMRNRRAGTSYSPRRSL